jgi:hypothetical protein
MKGEVFMKKRIINAKWKEISIGDKILLLMEFACYLFVIGTIGAIIFAISKGFILIAGILVLSAVGLFSCGRSARSTRDSRMKVWQLNFKMNNKKINNYNLKSVSKLYN